jgi:hypothetical protein
MGDSVPWGDQGSAWTRLVGMLYHAAQVARGSWSGYGVIVGRIPEGEKAV